MDDVVYDIQVCLDNECWELETTFRDGVSQSTTELAVGRDGSITLLLGDTAAPSTRT